jgi:hypothetical protein
MHVSESYGAHLQRYIQQADLQWSYNTPSFPRNISSFEPKNILPGGVFKFSIFY